MSAAGQTVQLGTNSGLLTFEAATFALDIDLGTVYSADTAACKTEPAGLPKFAVDTLVARLDAEHSGSFQVTIDPAAAAGGTPSIDNSIALRDDIWLQLGRNNDRIGAGFPTVVYSGTSDISDATQTRTFTFTNTTGDVRVTWRYDGNGDGKVKANDPVGHLTCPLSNMAGNIVVTVGPAS